MASPASPTVSPPPAVDPSAVRVVLFGMPGAGKTSLLGALAQAAQLQERALGCRLIDLTSGLADLRHQVYDDQPRETVEEIVPYSVAFDPLTASAERESAVLVDCDGRVANELLTNSSLRDNAPTMGLAGAIAAADALILVVDAADQPTQVDAELTEFVRFLRLLRRQRGQRTDVGGLPVSLVLSKCDLLAKPDDSPAAWQARVDARLAEVGQRFHEFLAADPEGEAVPFGDIDLELAATAVHWPALSGMAARPGEPWGVAELFRGVLAAAHRFHERRRLSSRRVGWTILGSILVVGGLVAFGAGVLLQRPTLQPSELASKVESYRAREGQTPSVRLTEPLQRKIGELTDLTNDPGFAILPADSQEYVKGHLAELESYRAYKEGLTQLRSPAEARSLDDLAEIERSLKVEQPPPAFRDEWRQTDAVQIRDKWLDDVKAIRKAAVEVEEWYRRLAEKGNRLLVFADRTSENAPLPWTQWLESVDGLTREAASPPFRRGDRLRDSRAAAGAPAVTFSAVFSYPSIDQVRGTWEKVRLRLDRLRDIAQALGLVGEGGRPATLRLTDRFTADQAGELLAALRASYPTANEWSLGDVPDVAAAEVRRAAQASYQQAIRAGREVIRRHYLEQYPDGRETTQRWQTVADWLPAAADLHDWRELTHLLLKLSDPAADDPVNALATFLRRERFEFDLRSIRLTIPDDLRDSRLRPAGKLVIHNQSTNTSLTFRLEGDGVHDPRQRLTSFPMPVEGTLMLTVRPGDAVSAEMPAKDALGREWKLSWSGGYRSPLYQWECLALPPRLNRADQKPEAGERAEGVTLMPAPERGLPRVPDLLPSLR
jgi:hypothetical protein